MKKLKSGQGPTKGCRAMMIMMMMMMITFLRKTLHTLSFLGRLLSGNMSVPNHNDHQLLQPLSSHNYE
jgi:hypothetical protein